MVRGQVVSYFDCNSNSIISMPFSLNFRSLKKKTSNGQTDGQTFIKRCVDASKKTKQMRQFQTRDGKRGEKGTLGISAMNVGDV